jgi:hypothetical protein
LILSLEVEVPDDWKSPQIDDLGRVQK